MKSEKTISQGEEFEVDAEKELDKYFPKGDDRRGQAMVILATARLQEQEKILKLIDKLKQRFNDKVINSDTRIISEDAERVFNGDKVQENNYRRGAKSMARLIIKELEELKRKIMELK